MNLMEEEKKELAPEKEPSNSYIRIRKFKFVMLIFILVFASVATTAVALSFGEESTASIAAHDRKEFKKLYSAYDKLQKEYYKDLDNEKLINGAITGMLGALDDPYTDYMNEDEAKKFSESVNSSFQGIGAEVQEKGGFVTIVSPIKGSPAEKAGLKPHDQILEVDGKSIRGMSANEAVMLIRGKKGTKVTLTIQRSGTPDPIKYTIVRDDIPIDTVYAEMLENGVAKIQITSFSAHTTKELKAALENLEKKGMKSLVLDVRQNPGGLLPEAVSISDMFVPKGKLLFQVKYKDGRVEEYRSKDDKKVNVPVVLLIDGGSASAAEILAGAVSESAEIPLVGTKTFGKGTVQTQADFKDGSNLKFTMAKWLTPSGNWIHQKGIEPDYKVDLPKYADLPVINPETELKESTLSNEVKAAEEMLSALGYTPGKVDGYYDGETANAVKDFQKDSKLKVTGVLQGETTVALMNRLREQIVKEDPQLQKAVEVLSEQSK